MATVTDTKDVASTSNVPTVPKPKRVRKQIIDEDVILTARPSKNKIDLAAFELPVDPEKDFISRTPPEVIDNILSYCVRDHVPELANMTGKRSRHVLVSLAAMSTLFRDCVESFCQRQLIADPARTGFKTAAELRAQQQKYEDAWPERYKPTRRSARVAAKPQPADLPRIYRTEFVRYLIIYCIGCDKICGSETLMLSNVSYCTSCELRERGGPICLSDALKQYDLRDYMLIAARKPGPRAKHTNLPLIPYCTKSTGTAIGVGKCISYRFYINDVKMIARIVHGDVKARMAKKTAERQERKNKKVRVTKRELKIEKYKDIVGITRNEKKMARCQKRLQHYEALDANGGYESDAVSEFDYDERRVHHVKMCKLLDCDRCENMKVDWKKYDMEYMSYEYKRANGYYDYDSDYDSEYGYGHGYCECGCDGYES
ncbi:hypothetical protein LTR17_017425 [Elasticomyces elasticus]|nr:hypothetical protein LTR17_017425 [Elasticomyces elasticus]